MLTLLSVRVTLLSVTATLHSVDITLLSFYNHTAFCDDHAAYCEAHTVLCEDQTAFCDIASCADTRSTASFEEGSVSLLPAFSLRRSTNLFSHPFYYPRPCTPAPPPSGIKADSSPPSP
ncbi:unnamed protein product, partial [Laminaria digitata]